MGSEAMSEIFDHAGLSVTDFDAALKFYTAALGTLGIKALANFEYEGDRHAGFGITRPEFWIGTSRTRTGGFHVAFIARSRSEVIAYHSAALAAGGRDNGGPGLRAEYSANYFAAFVCDPDGNNIEAVCHAPG
jgi:catechol 2,3-dioxygenase-like lactoylglutathione lyase family enzyme